MTDGSSTDDRQLLRRFTEHNSQEAFAVLTARYLSLVYSVCRREIDDDQIAEDVTQAVFLILARKAPTLGRNVVLSGWLFQTARFAAKNARLQAQRRAAYEQKAAEAMGEQPTSREDAAWSEIEPLLNRSLAALREGDRECVLLRFFQGLSFAEAGAALGLSEEAARKRVARALEKMRAFLGKEGVLIPGVALAALLTAHAAKAAPLTCQASIAHMTASAGAGHVNLSVTGSHVHQLSEGVMRAMKIAQVKAAVGVAAGLLIGFSVYAVARGMPLAVTMVRQVVPLTAVPKPGHVLVQAPGEALTALQIAVRCRQAYAALESYQVTSTVTTRSVTATDPIPREYHTSATIRFAHPGRIWAEGTAMDGHPYAYVSDGAVTVEKTLVTKGIWRKDRNTEQAVASVTGVALSAATTVPALLLGMGWGTPLALGPSPEAEVREDEVDGHACYVLTAHRSGRSAMIESLWVDEKTFLLRRSLSDTDNAAMSFTIGGTKHTIPPLRSHDDQKFTDERLNETIPESTFKLPVSQ